MCKHGATTNCLVCKQAPGEVCFLRLEISQQARSRSGENNKNIHKKFLFITLPLLLSKRLLEAGPADPARVAPSSPRCSCSCCCRKPDAKGNANKSTNKQGVDSGLVNKAPSPKKVTYSCQTTLRDNF